MLYFRSFLSSYIGSIQKLNANISVPSAMSSNRFLLSDMLNKDNIDAVKDKSPVILKGKNYCRWDFWKHQR